MEESTIQENSNLYLSNESQAFLKETAKWAYFLSILGFIGIGFMVLLGLFMGTLFTKFTSLSGGTNPMMGLGTGFITFIYLVISLVYFFPIYYLFQFSSKLKKAFKLNDNEQLNTSFQYLKSHYKFMGILALIFVCIYGFIIFIAMIAGIFSAY